MSEAERARSQAATATRRRELAVNLAALEDRLVRAAASAGRRRDDLVLVAVTKTFPATDVRLLAQLGVSDVGENRDQEAVAKRAALQDLPLRWHFVGRLQRNKCRSVASYAALVHSVDRDDLVTALARGALEHHRELPVLVQVALDQEPRPGRGGVVPVQAARLADEIAETSGVRLLGVMGVAPLGADPAPAFDRLARAAARIREDHPGASVVSAGMSGDLEAAVAYGATHLRVGTALLGSRSQTVG